MTPGERARYDSACAGKDRHASREAALAIAARDRAPLEPYRCRFCECWHLATPKGYAGGARSRGRAVPFQKLRHHRAHHAHPRRPVTFPAGTAPTLEPVTCRGGVGFPSELDAIRSARDTGAAIGQRLRAYLCPCGAWHLAARGGRR